MTAKHINQGSSHKTLQQQIFKQICTEHNSQFAVGFFYSDQGVIYISNFYNGKEFLAIEIPVCLADDHLNIPDDVLSVLNGQDQFKDINLYSYSVKDKPSAGIIVKQNTPLSMNQLNDYFIQSLLIREHWRASEVFNKSPFEQAVFLDSQQLLENLASLHRLNIKLANIETINEIYKEAVSCAITELGFDRMGILLFDYKRSVTRGSWGTTAEGELRDESYFSQNLNQDLIARLTNRHLDNENEIAVVKDATIWDNAKNMGEGWNYQVGLWGHNSKRPLGYISCDNLLKHRPDTLERRQILILFASIVGQIVSLKENELRILNLNQQLSYDMIDAQGKLSETQELLMESERLSSLGRLVAGISHDVSTPLGNCNTMASFLEEETTNFIKVLESGNLKKSQLTSFIDSVKDASHSININIHRAKDLMIKFKQVSADQNNDVIRTIKLQEYIDQLVASVSPEIKRTRTSINSLCRPDLTISTHPGALGQVVTNLIINAITHGFNDRHDGEIIIEVSGEGDTITLSIADNGHGIDNKHVDKIFDQFFTTRKEEGGTGLGLHMVKDLTENQLQGHICVDSQLKKGTKFTVTLPNLKAPEIPLDQ